MKSHMAFDKSEIINSINTKSCCAYAFLSAVIKSTANLTEKDGNIQVFVKIDDKDVLKTLKNILSNFYATIEIKSCTTGCKLLGKQVGDMLVDIGIFNKADYSLNYGIESSILEEECCKITFVKSLYLVAGKLYLSERENQKTRGYHLEFLFKDYSFMDDVLALLESLGLQFKKHQRFCSQMIYAKNSATICDFFSLIGAVEHVLKIENSLTIRDVRNNVNRANNCFEANLSKTIDASILQLEAIKYIFDVCGSELLNESEKEIALLRLANPEAPLSVLMRLYTKQISRAGMKYKLDKIVKIYKSRKN